MSVVVDPDIACEAGGACAGATVNGLSGAVTLAEGSNITITPVGNTLTIASTGGGGGADQALSNLASTAINTDLTTGSGVALSLFTKSGDDGSSLIEISSGSPATGDSGPVVMHSGGVGVGNNSGSMAVYSSGTGPGGRSGDVALYSGNTYGDGDTGDVLLKTGTVEDGTRGVIQFQNGSEGISGYVWTSTNTSGSGTWAAASGGGANTSLSNLASVAVNDNILPNADNTRNLGSNALRWGIVGAASVTGVTSLFGSNGNDLTIRTQNYADVSKNIILSPESAGTRGKIQFQNGSEGTAGQVWTSTDTSGSGTWAAAGAGANTALSNLTTTAINADLNFASAVAGQIRTADTSIAVDAGFGGVSKANIALTTAGDGGAGVSTGDIILTTGDAATGAPSSGGVTVVTGQTTTSQSGSFSVNTGASTISGNSGSIDLLSGHTVEGLSGNINIASGTTADSTGISGAINISSGESTESSANSVLTGNIQIVTGNVSSSGTGCTSGLLSIGTGTTSTGTGSASGGVTIGTGSSGYQSGELLLITGDGTVANDAYSGGVTLATGAVTGTANSGDIRFVPGSIGTGLQGKVSVESRIQFLATNTAGGTTGAQTINKSSGTVNFAATATTLVVTNSLVTADSIVFAVVRTDDSTATIKNVVPTSGSFTIKLTAAATAETSVGFFVINQ